MKRTLIGIVVVGLSVAVVPERAVAQDVDWWEWALREVVESRDSRDAPVLGERGRRSGDREARRAGTLADIIFGRGADDREERTRSRDRNEAADRRGPPFCRSGAGHPVHGQEWCREKGFGLGSDRVRWEDRGWEDVIFGGPRERERRVGTTDRGGLIDVLGDVVYRRLVDENRRLGGSAPLSGRWIRPGGVADVLQVRSGSLPVAELTDLDGDGRVDAVLVPRR